MPSYSLPQVMQGLFILSLIILAGCGAVNCLDYFDRGFLVLQGILLCLGAGAGFFIGGPLRSREYISVIAAAEWLLSYGHFGPALGVYGVVTIWLLFNRTLQFPSLSQMILFCFFVGAMCVSPAPWENHQQLILGMVLGAGLLVKERSIHWRGEEWQHLTVGVAAVLALTILGAEYGYYYHGDSHAGIVHPHYIGSVLLCALLGFWSSWQVVSFSPRKAVNVVALMVSTILLYTVLTGFGAIWWEYVSTWWGGGGKPADVARELAVPSGWLVEGVPYSGLGLFVLIAVTIISPVFRKGMPQEKAVVQSVSFLWSCFMIGGITPASIAWCSEPDYSGEKKRSWMVGILTVACSLSLVRLWEHRPYYLPGSHGSSAVAALTPLERTLLAAEDIFFCRHSGVDFARLKWVLRDTLRHGSFDRGASTLTMQLVKVRHLSYEKSILRKAQQVLVALWYEARFDKHEIMNMYLDEVSFGPYITGIEQASQYYFHKKSSDLGLREIEYLVATIEDPAHFSPQQLPNVPRDVAGRLERIRDIRGEFNPYLSRACENS